jgi:hypothetical protein
MEKGVSNGARYDGKPQPPAFIVADGDNRGLPDAWHKYFIDHCRILAAW